MKTALALIAAIVLADGRIGGSGRHGLHRRHDPGCTRVISQLDLERPGAGQDAYSFMFQRRRDGHRPVLVRADHGGQGCASRQAHCCWSPACMATNSIPIRRGAEGIRRRSMPTKMSGA